MRDLKIKTHMIRQAVSYFFIFFLISLTGFEFFFRSTDLIYLLTIISFIAFLISGKRVNRNALLIIMAAALISFLQNVFLGAAINGMFSIFLRLLTYYFIAVIVEREFIDMYINIILFLCVMSLVIYIGINAFDGFHKYLLDLSRNVTPINFDGASLQHWTFPNQSIYLYSVPITKIARNSGPFWEPGMFAVFLNLALILKVCRDKSILDWRGVVILAASITTMSVSSAIASFAIVFFFFFFIKRSILKAIIVFVILLVSMPLLNSEYLKGKIVSNLERIDEGSSRFGAALVHLKQIKRSPLIGYGSIAKTDQRETFGVTGVTPNGLTGVVRRFGIPFSVLYFLLLFRFGVWAADSTGNPRNFGYMVLFVLLIVAFSQDVTVRHFYLFLLFIPVISKDLIMNIKQDQEIYIYQESGQQALVGMGDRKKEL